MPARALLLAALFPLRPLAALVLGALTGALYVGDLILWIAAVLEGPALLPVAAGVFLLVWACARLFLAWCARLGAHLGRHRRLSRIFFVVLFALGVAAGGLLAGLGLVGAALADEPHG